MALSLVCPSCGKEFTSLMLYDEHLEKNSRLQFLETFEVVLKHEMQRLNMTSLQTVIDSFAPELQKIRQKKQKISKKERRKNPDLAKHKRIDRKKK